MANFCEQHSLVQFCDGEKINKYLFNSRSGHHHFIFTKLLAIDVNMHIIVKLLLRLVKIKCIGNNNIILLQLLTCPNYVPVHLEAFIGLPFKKAPPPFLAVNS